MSRLQHALRTCLQQAATHWQQPEPEATRRRCWHALQQAEPENMCLACVPHPDSTPLSYLSPYSSFRDLVSAACLSHLYLLTKKRCTFSSL